ncbi:MAG: helix-turn-helix domain-containing protein [Treponema sp.]|nr:helix-turn-helix domain-containing protein [Treponema sp.]
MIASKLADDCNFECTIDDDVIGFCKLITSDDITMDLVVCDFRLIQLSIIDIYELLGRRSTVLPLIFYNDPYPDSSTRSMYWLSQNEKIYDRGNLEYLYPLFEKINAIIEDPGIHPYISLLQPPLPLPGETCEGGGRQLDVRLFRKRNRLQPGLFKLFEVFYENQMHPLSLEELSVHLWGTATRTKTVYSYISRLRQCIAGDSFVKIDILRCAPGYYEMTVY